MKLKPEYTFFLVLILTISAVSPVFSKDKVKALFIPLADHYAALVAYERYGSEMIHADFEIEQMKNWDFLRAYFMSGEVEMAFVMAPLAMDMFLEKPCFRWIGLMHRDGNALAVNDLLKNRIVLAKDRKDRKPDGQVAKILKDIFAKTDKSTEIGIPHLLATHTVVLYRYLIEHQSNLNLSRPNSNEVFAIAVPPSKSPAFLKGKNNRAQVAAFEQSLPWADVVETENFGHVAWYSKDVMKWEGGHVECIALATDSAITNKRLALAEVMKFIHKAGRDIEKARNEGGDALDSIVTIVQKHIPEHTSKAIIASLDPDLQAINYNNLNIDKEGLRLIMKWAVKGNILSEKINIDEFADESFNFKTDEENENE